MESQPALPLARARGARALVFYGGMLAVAVAAFFIAPAIKGVDLRTLTSTHPTLEQRLEQLARIENDLRGRAGR